MSYHELLIGCGHSRVKRMRTPSNQSDDWMNLTTLDHNPDVKPDIECNIDSGPWRYPPNEYGHGGFCRLEHSSFDEIHAYEVLEHLGHQGDARSFFRDFSEIWRILKPNGYLCATTPSLDSRWLWGDPSHRRVISVESLTFLDQSQYTLQCDGEKKSPMSDFRNIYKADFKLIHMADNHETFSFILQAVKPSRIGNKT